MLYHSKRFLPSLLASSLSCLLLTACGVDSKPDLPTSKSSNSQNSINQKPVEFAVFTANEGTKPRAENGEVAFEISILNAENILKDDQKFTVDYAITGIDAILADDSKKTGTVTLSKENLITDTNGKKSVKTTITLPLKSDNKATPDFEATITLSNPTNKAVLSTSAKATAIVKNVDVGVGVANANAIKSTQDNQINFIVSTEPKTNVKEDTKVFFDVSGITAKEGINFKKPKENFVIIKKGESSTNLAIDLIGNPPEKTIELKVTLTEASTGTQLFTTKTTAIGQISSYVPESAKHKPLNDTGVTVAGNTVGNVGNCTGDMPANQDCNMGRDKTHPDNSDGEAGFSFTKLDNQGKPLPANALQWACVKDNVTGLVWEAKTFDNDKTKKDFRDAKWSYTYYDSKTGFGFPDTGKSSGKDKDSCGAENDVCTTEQYVLTVNDSKLCGLSNWRLPTRMEMLDIINLGSKDKEKVFHAGWLYPSKDAIPLTLWTSSPAINRDKAFNNVRVIYSDGSMSTDDPSSRFNYYGLLLVSNGQ